MSSMKMEQTKTEGNLGWFIFNLQIYIILCILFFYMASHKIKWEIKIWKKKYFE